MSAVEILRQARELIADKSRWTQDEIARAANGNPTDPRGGDAVCWCAVGAIEYCCKNEIGLFNPVFDALRSASYRLYGANIAAVNDGAADEVYVPAHVAVLEIFDSAI